MSVPLPLEKAFFVNSLGRPMCARGKVGIDRPTADRRTRILAPKEARALGLEYGTRWTPALEARIARELGAPAPRYQPQHRRPPEEPPLVPPTEAPAMHDERPDAAPLPVAPPDREVASVGPTDPAAPPESPQEGGGENGPIHYAEPPPDPTELPTEPPPEISDEEAGDMAAFFTRFFAVGVGVASEAAWGEAQPMTEAERASFQGALARVIKRRVPAVVGDYSDLLILAGVTTEIVAKRLAPPPDPPDTAHRAPTEAAA